MIAATFLIALGIYLGCGLLFSVPFVFRSVGQIDPHAQGASWGFRLLIVPGVCAFWPLFLLRWLRGIHEPPAGHNSHRCASRITSSTPL